MKHEMELTPGECRVIGALIEKELTTPDQYPLSLNALKNACNQKSSRDPVMNLAENEVQDILDDLRRKHLVLDRSGFGSRVPKYKQRFCNTEFARCSSLIRSAVSSAHCCCADRRHRGNFARIRTGCASLPMPVRSMRRSPDSRIIPTALS